MVTKTITTRRILHVVKPGETLGSIAARYNLSIPQLLTYNRLPTGTVLRAGQQIYASPAETVDRSQSAPTSSSNNVRVPASVQQNTTTTYGNTVQRINTPVVNNPPANTRVDNAYIPASTNSSTMVPAEVFTPRSPTPANYDTNISVSGQKQVHLVRDGETIESIAKLYGLSPSRLRSINLLSAGDVVIPLQKIYITQ